MLSACSPTYSSYKFFPLQIILTPPPNCWLQFVLAIPYMISSIKHLSAPRRSLHFRPSFKSWSTSLYSPPLSSPDVLSCTTFFKFPSVELDHIYVLTSTSLDHPILNSFSLLRANRKLRDDAISIGMPHGRVVGPFRVFCPMGRHFSVRVDVAAAIIETTQCLAPWKCMLL